MALVKKTTAPFMNSGVRVKPFRAERPPSQLELARRRMRQLQRELVNLVCQQVIQIMIDTLYVMRYLRIKFRGRGTGDQAAFETVPDPAQERGRVHERSSVRVEHATTVVE